MSRANLKVLSLLTVFVLVSDCALIDKFDLDLVLKGLGKYNSTSQCGNHMLEYLNGLSSWKPWALKMYDSSANKLYGKFMRQTAYINGYEECLLNEHLPPNFKMHYCVLDLNLYAGDHVTLHNLKPGIELEFEFSKFHRIKYGICLPRTCSYHHIETALNNYLNRTIGNEPSYITLKEESCSSKEALPLKGTDWLAVGVILLLALASVASTVYDVVQKKCYNNNKPNSLLKSFSMYSNFKIFSKASNSRFKVVDGIRSLSCIWVVCFHTGLVPWFGPVQNFKSIFMLSKHFKYEYFFLYNGILAVDTFFFLSGLLVANAFFKSMKDKGYYDIPRNYIHRYLRLTPSFALLTLIHGTISLHLGGGPLYKELWTIGADSCKENWWKLLSYTQNYATSSTICMGHCWYLSADMQLFWLSPVLLFPLYFYPALAPYLLAIPTFMFAFASFIVTYSYDFPRSIYSLTTLQMVKEYYPTHTRGAPWMIGLALGYIIYQINTKKIIIKLSKFKIFLGWLISISLFSISYHGPINFMYANTTALESASYITFHRVGWALGLAWIVFACNYGYGGPVNTFLSWKGFQPLAKLSYGIYLVHILIMEGELGFARSPMWVGEREGFNFFLSSITQSSIAAFLLLIYVDIPIANIDRYVFRNVKIFPLPQTSPLTVGQKENVDDKKLIK